MHANNSNATLRFIDNSGCSLLDTTPQWRTFNFVFLHLLLHCLWTERDNHTHFWSDLQLSLQIRHPLPVLPPVTQCFSCFAELEYKGVVMDLRCFSFYIVSHSKVLTLSVLQWTIALSPPPYWCTQCGRSHWSPTHWQFYYWGCWQSFGGAKGSCYCILQWVDYPDECRWSFVATHPEGEVWPDQGGVNPDSHFSVW